MKTNIQKQIKTVDDAKKYLLELIKNDEYYHPEDDAHQIIWQTTEVTKEECDILNLRMNEIYSLKDFDPCEFILDNVKTINQ